MNNFFRSVSEIFILFKKLSPNPIQLFVNLFKVGWALLFWKISKSNKYFTFNFMYNGLNFPFYADNRMDIVGLYEVFVLNEYDLGFNYEQKPKIILDLGANVGDTAIYYHLSFPDAEVYSVEASPITYKKLVKNSKYSNKIKTYNIAIGPKGVNELYLNISPSHIGSSIITRKNQTEKILVSSTSLNDFIINNKIERVDILKFDLEGAEEFFIQKEFVGLPIDVFIGEIHDDLTSIPLLPILESMNLKYFRKKKIAENRYIVVGRFNS